MVIENLSGAALDGALDDLVAVLRDAVNSGASVGFLPPLAVAEAAAYWQPVFDDVRDGKKILLVARAGQRIIGTVQLEPAGKPNGRHRAEVQKLLVHQDARRQGIGRALMLALETEARTLGRTLLVLDTLEGDAAEQFYPTIGYQRAGVVPGYALGPDGGAYGSVFMYKRLEA